MVGKVLNKRLAIQKQHSLFGNPDERTRGGVHRGNVLAVLDDLLFDLGGVVPDLITNREVD